MPIVPRGALAPGVALGAALFEHVELWFSCPRCHAHPGGGISDGDGLYTMQQRASPPAHNPCRRPDAIGSHL